MKIQELRHFIPSDVGKYSFFISIMAMFFALSMGQTECLNASSCSVGDDEVFEGNLEIRSTNPVGTVLKSTTTSNQKILELPNADGRLLSVPSSFFPMASNVFLKTDGTGALTLESLDIKTTDIDGTQGTNGQFLKTDGTANGVSWGDIPEINETTFNASNGTNGQILQVNSTGTLDFADISGGGGSFNAIASQNVVHGSVGLESNGQVRNIVPLQNGVNQLTLSQTSTGNPSSNIGFQSSHYNSNVDAQIIAYRDYDSNNQSTCSTHYYVDVVEQNSNGVLANWGRQCISDEWDMHLTNYGYSQYNNSAYPQGYDYCYSFDKYGLEEDNSVNNYVFVYTGCTGNNSNSSDGQIWSIPIQINTSNNTLIVGTEALLHDQHACNNNDACSNYSQQFYPNAIHSNVYAQQTSDANRMWIFYRSYRGGSYSNAGAWYKSYTCNFTQSTGDTCTPNQAYSSDMNVSSGSNQLLQNWYNTLSPTVWWDDNAQAFIIINRTTQNNSECRFAQMRLAENYNSANPSYSSTLNYVMGFTGVTDDISGGTFNVSGSSISCGRMSMRPIFDVENDQFIWMMSSGNTNDIDLLFYHLKGDTNSLTGTPIEVGLGSLQNLLSDEICANTIDRECGSYLYPLQGHVYIDNTVSPYKFYWHNEGLMDRNICTKDYQQSKCAEIYEWSMNNSTNFIDNTTFKHYDYQNPLESYHNDDVRGFGVWIDQGTDTLFTLNVHSNQAIDSNNNNKLHAIAFDIPDNIDTYIGFVNQSGSATNQVTVYSVGAVVDGFTGLTIGAEYFVGASGSVGTSGTYKIGRAIATDKIYITDTR